MEGYDMPGMKVSTTFALLLKEIESEINDLNHEGASALRSGDYDKAQMLMDRGVSTFALKNKVEDLQKEWEGIAKDSLTPEENVQNVHISMENRNARAFNSGSIQNFAEHYLSGNFTFEIDVTMCNEIQLGLIIEAVMKLRKLGRGCNSGYGRIFIKRFQLLRRYKKIFPEWQEDSFIVKEEIMERRMKQDVIKALQAWQQYVKEEISSKCN